MQAQSHFAAMNGVPLQHPHHQHAQPLAQSLPPPPQSLYHHPNPFHYHNGIVQPLPMPSNIGLEPHNGMMRFPIPPQTIAGAQMNSNRSSNSNNKKDIKRRTKTGCLTCRKRRIKCDEGHPTCRNCQKSKRECLGYDPIFKPQSAPAAIQPAPTNADSPRTTPPISAATGLPHSSSASSAYLRHRANFTPTTDGASDFDGDFQYGAGSYLDPSLSTSHHAFDMSSNQPPSILRPDRKVKHITIDQLFSINGVAARYQPQDATLSDVSIPQQEIDDLYRLHYAPGLDKLFETTWYSTRALPHLRQDHSLLNLFKECIQQFQSQDPTATSSIQSLEAQLIWTLAALPRSTIDQASTDTILSELLPRLEIVETLLTGQYLSSASLVPPAPSSALQTDHVKYNEQIFWHHLGTFVLQDDYSPNPTGKSSIDHALNGMRAILGMMENRDVLYSLAIARHLGGRLPGFDPRVPVTGVGEGSDGEELGKLEVARRFVELEDQKGTTQVVQRVCGMAMRAWVLLRD